MVCASTATLFGKIMNLKQIKNELEYREALKEIEHLMMANLNTLEGDKLSVLVNLVEVYESNNYPMSMSDQVKI